MPKISPTDKLFDELIPDSAEYWQAIENIDFEPKPKKSFWAYIKEFFASPIQDAIAETESNVFTPVNPNDFRAFAPINKAGDLDDYLEELYPDFKFSVMRTEVRISHRHDSIKIKMALGNDSWDIESEQEYQDLLSKVERGVNLIKHEQQLKRKRTGVVVLNEHP